MAQSVERLTLDFGLGHDPRVVGSSPAFGSVLGVEPAWDSLSVSVSHSVLSPLAFSLSFKRKRKERVYD